MNTPPRRTARWGPLAIAATVALCAGAPAATALDTTIRIEGSTATLVPESTIDIEADGTSATVYDIDFAAWPVGRGTAFWQVYRAASGAALDFGFRGYPFGLQVLKIGPDGSAGAVGWQYKVNHVAAQVGAEATQLSAGDEVLWFHGGFAGARDLDVTPSSDRVPRGTSFTVDVTSFDENGVASPAAGARVDYGPARATADARGRVTFIAQGAGPAGVRATRAGDVRSATRPVCSYADDPTVCNLPPQPLSGVAPAGPDADTVPPGSAVRVPALGATRAAVRALRGTAGPDRSDIAQVEVSVGLRVGTLCRFRAASGALTPARDCARPEWVTARLAGGNWILPLGRRGLTPGVWRIETRATDGAGNIEAVRVPGANIGALRVRGRVVSPLTRITAPRHGARAASPRAVRGTAGPTAADISLVEVALARRVVGGGCRFITASGRLGSVRSCARPLYLPARSRGARWALPLRSTPPPGSWRALARARGAEGAIGRPAVANFRVGGGAR